MLPPAELDLLMHRAWPAIDCIDAGGWIARLSGGVTRRANSVLPLHAPADLPVALTRVEALYRDRGLPPTFQLSPTSQPPALDALLAARGYRRHAHTLVYTAAVERVIAHLAPDTPVDSAGEERITHLDDDPDDAWMRLWSSVDGRGDIPDAETIARRIMTACPARYASLADTSGDIAAVGRLALVGRWGGIYGMAVRPDARRRGHARAILGALARDAAARGITHLWLQVTADNEPAKSLYTQAGFGPTSEYWYRRLCPACKPGVPVAHRPILR